MSVAKTPAEPSQVYDPLSVMKRFSDLRGQILQVLGEGVTLTESLGSRKALVSASFEGARRSVDLSRLNLVVIGGEGHGKSTLIHAVLGTELTPREGNFPGTVAPVYIEWGNVTEPEFTIVVETPDDKGGVRQTIQPCHGGDAEFRSYILQRDNPGNKKNVAKGLVRCNHPMLQQGLRLVDVPGLEGVSTSISRDSREFISQNAHAVIGVVKGREFGPLIRLIDTFIKRSPKDKDSGWMQAIIVNQPRDFYDACDTADQLNGAIRECASAAGMILERDGGIDFDPQKMFVLHLPSVVNLRENKPTKVAAEFVQPETRRFDRSLNAYIRDNGVLAVITQGAAEARRALGDLHEKLRIRHNVLDTLLNGDESEGRRVTAQFDQAAAAARARWQAHVVEDNVVAIAEEHWKALKPVIDQVRDSILTEINAVQREVEATEERINKTKAKEIEKNLSAKINSITDQIQSATEQAIRKVVADFCVDANNVMKHLYAEVPVLDVGGDGIDLITPERLVDATLGSMEEGMLDKFGKGAAIGGGALVGGKVAIAVFAAKAGAGALAAKGAAGAVAVAFPPVGAAMLIIGGGYGAYKLWGLIRDGQKAAVLKRLTECRGQVHNLDTSRGSQVHTSWIEVVKGCVDEVGSFFESQVSEVEQVVKVPKDGAGKLKEGLEQTAVAINGVRMLEQRLTRIETAINA